MAPASIGRKRKAVTKDSAASEEPALVDELGNRPLDLNADDDEHALDHDLSLSILRLDGQDHDSQSDRTGEEQQGQQDHTVMQDANGNPRYVYRDIDPVYDSDDSDAPIAHNVIGDIPLSFYDSYPHIGYDLDGKKVMRPAKGAALDSLLDSIEIPRGWTGLTDPATGKPLQLSEEELAVLKRLARDEVPEEGYDPYPDTIEYFTSITEHMPLSAAPEPKRRFVPSKHEAARVMKIVKAIREGRIQPYKPPSDEDELDQEFMKYDLWAQETPRPDHAMNMPAPKLPPPGYEESYHPPAEYLPDDQEVQAWHDQDEEDREKDYLPTTHDALRKVPGYGKFVKEKFERCLDLYLAPRVRRSKLNIDPESLLPKLPNPEELRPFPTYCKMVYRGHVGRVRSVAICPHNSKLLATGGDDGTVRLYDLETGQQLWNIKLADREAVNMVRWRPTPDCLILSAAVGECVYLIVPSLPHLDRSEDHLERAIEVLNQGFSTTSAGSLTESAKEPAKWIHPLPHLRDAGVHLQVTLRSSVKVISWHRHGDYFSTVSPQGQSQAIAIHTLSQHKTQIPIRKLKALAQTCAFHPSKPIFFVATQRMVRVYDLARQELLKALQPGARWISSIDVHPGGENILVGSYDKRLLWMDMELSAHPYKTLRYHQKAIRSVRFHPSGYPLFADASDDGSIQIFHGKVHHDLMENATIVPLKVLKGHEVNNGLGVLDIDWHPHEAQLVSAGADGSCRLWAP